MRNNTRRNRNIGTAKQGYGQNNKMQIAEPLYNSDIRSHLERLGRYKKESKQINGHKFIFITEELHKDFYHACTLEDITEIIKYIPKEDYGNLKFIVFRQPKRKERILSPVWGQLIYSYEFEGEHYPAIIESSPIECIIKWERKLKVQDRLELERLMNDGHKFIEEKNIMYRNYYMKM